MRRCNVNHPRSAQPRVLYADTFRINGKRRDLCAGSFEGRDGADVSGIFHAHVVARIDEDPCRQIERLLHTGNDRDLVGRAVHAARGIEIIGQRLSQRTVADCIASQHEVGRESPQPARVELCPQIDRKEVHGRNIRAKGAEAPALIASQHAHTSRVV